MYGVPKNLELLSVLLKTEFQEVGGTHAVWLCIPGIDERLQDSYLITIIELILWNKPVVINPRVCNS